MVLATPTPTPGCATTALLAVLLTAAAAPASSSSPSSDHAAAAAAAAATPRALGRAGASDAGHAQPPLVLEFFSEMHIAQGYGHDGDGCALAAAALKASPIVSEVWFDAPGQRLAQTNPQLRPVNPYPNLTVIGRFDEAPPTEIDINVVDGRLACQTEPLPPAFCQNGSRVCPPQFGDFGSLDALTSVLGMNYYNTTLLASPPGTGTEIWQWESVIATKIPVNGTIAVYNITRNYTYTLSAGRSADGPRQLLRYQWTQSIPLRPDSPEHPVHRDCFVFDYTTRYTPGPIDPARWVAPPGVVCKPGAVYGLELGLGAATRPVPSLA